MIESEVSCLLLLGSAKKKLTELVGMNQCQVSREGIYVLD